ncbi:hypothetical protein AKJ64_03640 [candidate division MSBL1 archaeon SCGC-AAA259E17]|uniref:Uncharacterized protein n=1 Tax=candidate division MSBL1 archaeon SCGC-AAA259E17 TaxID=1698263 RepID=A0A133UDI9_9EURY|nr:hypothetical protein AKJ64_03640 [candidate division MSBL1 archaeon SCGC-AAA259E17]
MWGPGRSEVRTRWNSIERIFCRMISKDGSPQECNSQPPGGKPRNEKDLREVERKKRKWLERGNGELGGRDNHSDHSLTKLIVLRG